MCQRNYISQVSNNNRPYFCCPIRFFLVGTLLIVNISVAQQWATLMLRRPAEYNGWEADDIIEAGYPTIIKYIFVALLDKFQI